MEVAVRIGDETAAEERAAQVRYRAAVPPGQPARHAVRETRGLVEDPEVGQRAGQSRLRRHGDQVVVGLVQDRAAHGQLGLETVELVQQLDHLARDGRGLGRDLER